MDEQDQKALDDIEEYGCHILHILEEGDYPRFTYSIGIEQTSRKPELVILGLKHELANWMINEYNSRLRAGESFEPGKYYEGFLEGFEVTFQEVSKEHYKEYFGWGLWLYKGNNFKVLQLVYPSTSGIWPWDQNAPESFTWLQPLLSEN